MATALAGARALTTAALASRLDLEQLSNQIARADAEKMEQEEEQGAEEAPEAATAPEAALEVVHEEEDEEEHEEEREGDEAAMEEPVFPDSEGGKFWC